MDGGIIAIVYGVVLVLFFILLVVLTITLILSKSKKDDEDEYEDDYEEEEYQQEYDLFAKSEDNKKEWYEEGTTDNSGVEEVLASIDNSYEDLGRNEIPSIDSAFVDSAFSDSAFSDSAFEDSAFAEPVKEVPQIDPMAQTQEIPPVKRTTKIQQDIPTVLAEPIAPVEPVMDSAFAEPIAPIEQETVPQEDIFDSAFEESNLMGDVADSAFVQPIVSQIIQAQPPKKRIPSNVPNTDDFYWYNKLDVAEKPSYKTEEMYHHHFNIAKDCIEDLLIEMYDCALVRTEEIKYIAYGIAPRAVTMKEILTSGNRNYTAQKRLKEPTAQDLAKIYEKWCGYVDLLFDKVYIHADEYTINEIYGMLCQFGRSDVDVLIEGM